MIRKIINFMYGLRDRQRILICLSKGGAMMQARDIDHRHPETWEFSGFSQNGEDGILDVLRKQLLQKNRYFVEIGAADGIDNNSAWLVIAEKHQGLMIEGSPELVERAKRMVGHYSLGLKCLNLFVDVNSAATIKSAAMYADPDILSLDIDGIDYYVARALLAAGMRPKIIVVEYNSVFGPDAARTVKYAEGFVYTRAHPSELYYGVSIAAWRKLFEAQGYRFVTVDRNGVNAFFIDPAHFRQDFLAGVKPRLFAENQLQLAKFGTDHAGQFKLIAHMEFQDI